MKESIITPETPKRDPRAFNAYRHGLTGQVVIMTPADELAYKSHCEGFHKSLSPEGAVESSLVQSIADDRWRLLRAGAIDNSTFAIRLGDPDHIVAHHEEIDAALAQAVAWASDAKNLNLLTLYEGRIQRRVEKNLQLVKQLQAERQAALQKAVEEANLLAQLAATKGETFDIERDFPREALPPQFDFSTAQIARLAAHARRLDEAKTRRVGQALSPANRFHRAA